MRNTKIITFAPIIAFATLKAVSLQLTGMIMMRKIQQAMQGDAIWARIHPAFIPVTGMKSHMAKFPALLPRSRLEKTEISGTEPARPVIWTHRGRGMRRDLGNRASLPSHMNTSRLRQGETSETGLIWSALEQIWPTIESVSTRIKKQENRNTGSNPDFSYPNLSPLPLRYHKRRPAKIPKILSTYTSKLSFLTVTSTTAEASPFHNF